MIPNQTGKDLQGIRIGMVDPLGQIIMECTDGRLPAKSIALTYAFALRQEPKGSNFGPANQAIRTRFKTDKDPDGLKALGRIKALAWAYVEGRKQP
jgi:hypothetical protein